MNALIMDSSTSNFYNHVMQLIESTDVSNVYLNIVILKSYLKSFTTKELKKFCHDIVLNGEHIIKISVIDRYINWFTTKYVCTHILYNYFIEFIKYKMVLENLGEYELTYDWASNKYQILWSISRINGARDAPIHQFISTTVEEGSRSL